MAKRRHAARVSEPLPGLDAREPGAADAPDSSGVHPTGRGSEAASWRALLGPNLSPEIEALVDAHEHLERRYGHLLRSAEALAGMLERVPWGLALVERGHVVAANTEARHCLRGGGTLQLNLDGSFTCADAELEEELHGAFEAAALDEDTIKVIEVPRGNRVITLTILSAADVHRRALLVTRDPRASFGGGPEVYARLYELTPGEARVAQQIALGRSPQEIADVLGIGLATVRSHLKATLSKLGCKRQAELVRVLVTGPAALTD